MKSFVLLIIFSFCSHTYIFAQEDSDEKHHLLQEKIGQVKKALLNAKFSKRKKLLKSLEVPSLTALSYYPELLHTRISFRKKHLPYSMNAQPTFLSMFRPINKRKYVIRVNSILSEKSGFIADSLEFNAQVGLIGHEFAHIAYYQSKTGLQLLKQFVKYAFSKKFRRKWECDTDISTINHGLGYQLLYLAKYLENGQDIPKEYRKKHKKNYLQSHEIEAIIKK